MPNHLHGVLLYAMSGNELLSLPITHPTRRKMSGTACSGLFLTARRGLLTSDGVIGRDSQAGLEFTQESSKMVSSGARI